MLQVETEGLKKERLQTQVNDVRGALRDAKILYTGLGVNGDKVTVRITNTDDVAKAAKAIEALATNVSGGLLSGGVGQKDIKVTRFE